MKKRSVKKSFLSIFLPLLMVSALAGCVVHSINPFYTRDLITDIPALYGQWMLRESVFKEGTDKPWIFSKDSIIIPGIKGASATLSARFFKVNDMVFLDTIAADPQEDVSLWWTLHISPMHTVSKVVVSDNMFRVIPLDASWMEESVKNKTVTLPSVWHEEQKMHLFTASGAEWVEFLKKYGSDPNAFPEKDAFVFERPQQK